MVPQQRAMESTIDPVWWPSDVRLRFRLGEVPVASMKIPALVLNAHFTELPLDSMEPPPPFERLSPPVELLLSRSHPIETALPRFTILPHALRYVPHQYRRHFIDMSGSFEGYMERFSSKSRSTVTRKVRKFLSLSGGTADFRTFTRPEEMAEFHGLARGVSQKTYQENLLGRGLPDGRDFVATMQTLASQDRVRAYLLFHKGAAVAYLYCPVENGTIIYDHLGYDPEFKALSPGTVLQQLALERLFAEAKFKMFDFTEGEGAHKEFFATGSNLCADIYYFRRTPRNLGLLGIHAGLATISNRAVAALERLGLKKRIKALIRARA
jgi:Protein involved in cellulose biosynthesis (CelD)